MKNFISSLFICQRWYWLMGSCVLFFIISFFIEGLFEIVVITTLFAFVLTAIDIFLLYKIKGNVKGLRIIKSRFSLGDENKVSISLINAYPFPIKIKVIEQLPKQFQVRDFSRRTNMEVKGRVTINYLLKPLTRGEYHFGKLLGYVESQIGLVQKRYELAPENDVKVYPSFLQIKKYQLIANSEIHFTGIRKVRRLGHSMEFEKIKNYVQGDDVRSINWKATARSSNLMVNMYTDAKEQQIYVLIDKGRSMKMPFDGMTLLDYSINAGLSILNIALLKNDRAGLITFSNQIGNLIPAEKRSGQLNHLAEALYLQKTDFLETDFEMLLATVLRKINQRSFLLLFTNFETYISMERQLPYLKSLAKRHLVCVVLFQNTMLESMQKEEAQTTEDIYIQTIANQFNFEKKQIVKELRKHGIMTLLTTPKSLTIDTINKYMELKSRQLV